jgi:multiple sugar transport system permease protein
MSPTTLEAKTEPGGRGDTPRPVRRRSGGGALAALPWIGPALVLIVAIVVFPAGYLVWTSLRKVSQYGLDRGFAGLDNYSRVLGAPQLPRVLLNTVVWVVGVVVVTLVISLALAQFLAKRFPGRKIVRLAVIVPWAASVVMTSTVFAYGLDPFYGIINRALVDVGLLDQPYGFLKQPVPAFLVAMAVAVFVSLPFSTYTLLAGLQTIPEEIFEASRVDGATRSQQYRRIVLPLLRPAIAVGAIINIINVFNSLPILRILTGSIPGYDADTTTTLMFKYIQSDRAITSASALSVVNFVLVLVVIIAYLRVVRPLREE